MKEQAAYGVTTDARFKAILEDECRRTERQHQTLVRYAAERRSRQIRWGTAQALVGIPLALSMTVSLAMCGTAHSGAAMTEPAMHLWDSSTFANLPLFFLAWYCSEKRKGAW